MPQLYLDCDGVLADFEGGAARIFGMGTAKFQQLHGPAMFWKELAAAPYFYANLDPLPGAMRLFEAVRHLNPIILTGLPRGNWAAPQKQRWAAEHFPGTRIITCMAADKRNHCRDGDVLVDDMRKHRHLWKQAGGVFIHHKLVDQTLVELASLFQL